MGRRALAPRPFFFNNMTKKITFCDYIADKSPGQAYDVLKDSGLNFPTPKSNRHLAEMLKSISKQIETLLLNL